jgi:TolA-binding protein
MDKSDIAVVAGITGLLVGGWAFFSTVRMEPRIAGIEKTHESDNDSIAGLGGRVKDVDESVQTLSRRVSGLSGDPKKLWEEIAALQARLDRLEHGRGVAAVVHDPDPAKASDPSAPHKWTAAEAHDLHEKLFSGNATDEDRAKLQQAMTSLEGDVKEMPNDIPARLALADLYIAKLMTVPQGMEQGVWSNKAVQQWNKVIELDPDNWDAHSALGSNYSFWPEQFNKRPDAIKEFETARKIQERSTPEAKHADTYLQLNLLYLKDGKADKAREALDEGLRRFPDDEDLKKAKDGAK